MTISTRSQAKTRAESDAIVSPESLPIIRLPLRFEGDDRRVIVRPLILGSTRVMSVLGRVARFDEPTVERLLARVLAGFGQRHENLEQVFDSHFARAATLTGFTCDWSLTRRRLAGSYFSMEYAIDSAALFNPSIVPHFDQTGLDEGSLRFIMSLRATGEGHLSSIVFRTGVISRELDLTIDPPPPTLHTARVDPDHRYEAALFRRKLGEMGVTGEAVDRVMQSLPPEGFTIAELSAAIERVRPSIPSDAREALRAMQWLANSNYHIRLARRAQLSELVIFPMSEEEARGIEDLRLVQFHDNGTVRYFGTYTAYNGMRTLPMIVETSDFHRIDVHTLNGPAATNKGFALFPRKIGGRFVMCSRIDGENLYISESEYVHFWESAQRLRAPKNAWELVQLGNCGSPIETPEGWVLLTHGVGPMRSYAIGAMLLDRNDPLKVIGHLDEPLITPVGEEREGYVPNVVYTCGALLHAGHLFVPYAQADKSTSMAVVAMDELINRLLDSRPGA